MARGGRKSESVPAGPEDDRVNDFLFLAGLAAVAYLAVVLWLLKIVTLFRR